MSHFCVLVIADAKPDEAKLAVILQPWHEYECTGVKDHYVIPVDTTDEVTEYFNEPQTVIVMSSGEVVSRWDDRFYTGPKKYEWDSHGEFEIPKGAEECKMPADEARQHGIGYKTLEEAAEGYNGAERAADGKFYKLTNENAHWDWYQVGGRYTGRLATGYDPEKDPENQEVCFLCTGTGERNDDIGVQQRLIDPSYKCNGCNGKGMQTKWPTQWRKVDFDCMRKGDVRWDTLRSESEKRAGEEWDKVRAIIGHDATWLSWKETREKFDGKMDEARDFYNAQEPQRQLSASKDRDMVWVSLDDFAPPRDKYAKHHGATRWQPFAFVMDGQWHERGDMGWWGIVSDEKDYDAWSDEFNKMLDALPDDAWLTVVDCHI